MVMPIVVTVQKVKYHASSAQQDLRAEKLFFPLTHRKSFDYMENKHASHEDRLQPYQRVLTRMVAAGLLSPSTLSLQTFCLLTLRPGCHDRGRGG
mmetsp:Transcript_2377/g.5605  ORF Transcript_2377/g.5605 Transcript_2377/m.5605 type:complete len:95 (-) Transcript_2377:1141-1425(-)